MSLVGWVVVLLLMTMLLGGVVVYYSFWAGFREGYEAGYEAGVIDELGFLDSQVEVAEMLGKSEYAAALKDLKEYITQKTEVSA